MYINTVFGFMGTFFYPSLLLSWMLEHDCLDTCCFGCHNYACVLYYCICTCSTQLSMFHVERYSRTILIIIKYLSSLCLSRPVPNHLGERGTLSTANQPTIKYQETGERGKRTGNKERTRCPHPPSRMR